MSITYLDDRYKERDWKVTPPIAIMSSIEAYLAQPVSSDVLIIHGGQRDANVTRISSSRTLLVEAVVRVCSSGGRAIVFSGGHGSIAPLRDQLTRESLQEGLHYLLLPAIQNLHQEIDFELLMKIRPTPEWRIAEAKKRYAVPTLLTLGVLCQSALLAFDTDSVLDEAVVLLGGRDAMNTIRRNCAFTGDHLLTPLPWQGALGTKAEVVYKAIDLEWPAGARPHSAIRALVDALFVRQRALDAETVSLAFVELYQALERNQELQH